MPDIVPANVTVSGRLNSTVLVASVVIDAEPSVLVFPWLPPTMLRLLVLLSEKDGTLTVLVTIGAVAPFRVRLWLLSENE